MEDERMILNKSPLFSSNISHQLYLQFAPKVTFSYQTIKVQLAYLVCLTFVQQKVCIPESKKSSLTATKF